MFSLKSSKLWKSGLTAHPGSSSESELPHTIYIQAFFPAVRKIFPSIGRWNKRSCRQSPLQGMREATLTMLCSPSAEPTAITSPAGHLDVTVGESIVLPCQVSHDPTLELKFTWFFNEQLIHFGNHWAFFEKVGGVSEVMTSLILQKRETCGQSSAKWRSLFPNLCTQCSPYSILKSIAQDLKVPLASNDLIWHLNHDQATFQG